MSWIELNDFRGGIVQKPSLNQPLGTATESHTWGCRSSRSGALIPLPRINATITMTPPTPPTSGNLLSEEYRIVGLGISGPHYGGPTSPTVGVDANLSELWVCIEAWDATKLYLDVLRYNRHQNTPTWESVWKVDRTATFNQNVRPRNCTFDMQWSNSANPDQLGGVVMGWVVDGYARMFPDDTDPSTTGTANLPGDRIDDPIPGSVAGADSLVAHQGRFVVFPAQIIGFGATSVFITTEAAYWTEQNNATALDPELAGEFLHPIAPTASPSGFVVKHSLAGDELLLIKPSGGAALLRGDISDPTIEHLPFVQSAGLSFNNGVKTNVGLMYPIDGGGVWLWSGGESTEELSQDMQAGFWRPPAVPTTTGTPGVHVWGHATTQCAAASDMVFFPNNWIFNLEIQSGWWRLDDPTVWAAHRWVVDGRNRYAYAASTGILDNTDPVLREYRIDRPTNKFSWQSQPIPTNSPGATISISSLELLATSNAIPGGAQGAGEVTVSLLTSEGATVTHKFAVPANTPDRPTWQRARTKIRGSYLQARIVSEATNSGDGAPVVHALRLLPESSRPTAVATQT
jgi:hypothetical protein